MFRNFVAIFALILLGTFLYGATLRGVSGNPAASSFKNNLDQPTKPFELSPERGRYLMTMSLGDFGRFDLSPELADAAYPDVGVFDGRYYIFFAPGISIIALPLYLLGKMYGFAQIGAFATVTLFAILNLVVLYKIGNKILKFSKLESMIAPIVFGFGSSAWSYATTLYQHQVTTFFVLSAFYAVWKYAAKQKFSWLWGVYVWMCYALAMLIDYPNAFLMAPVMIYFFINSFNLKFENNTIKINARLAFIFTSVLFVAISAWHGYFNYVNFGDWKKVSGSIVGVKHIKEIELQSANSQSKDEQIKAAEEEKNVVAFFTEYNIPFGLYTVLVSKDRGIFFYYPVFGLALLGIYSAFKKQITQENATLVGIIGASVFLYASWGDPWGGWAFGARYMVLVCSVLSLFVGYLIHSSRYRFMTRLVTFATFGFSAGVALLGALTTNAVPPQIEGDYLKMKYNFTLNYDFLMSGRSSSFFYNSYAHNSIQLVDYYILLYWIIMTVMLVILVSSYRNNKYAN
jgi:hypothetical protein